MSKEFKVGDKVYYPRKSTKVLTIHELGNPDYPIMVYLGSRRTYTFTIDGKIYIEDALPSIYHATPEKQKQLEDLHGIKLEDAPVKPTSKEIVKAYLDRGDKNVCCWVNNMNGRPTYLSKWVFIDRVIDGDCPFVDQAGRHWKHATPFDHTTRQSITELPK